MIDTMDGIPAGGSGPAEVGREKAQMFVAKTLGEWLTGPSLFHYVEVETISECNRKCSYCPNSTLARPEAMMETAVFQKLIDELGAMGFAGRLSPHFYGEPLLDPRLVDLVAYARGKLPVAQLKLFTNGDFLSLDLCRDLLEAGVDVIRIAQHGPRPSPTLARMLDLLDEATRKNHIEYIVYHAEPFALFNRGGAVPVRSPISLSRCDYASGLTIDYLGNVILCCNDYSSRHVFGNVARERVTDIWLKPEYRLLRYQIEVGIWPLEICRVCVGETDRTEQRPRPVGKPSLSLVEPTVGRLDPASPWCA